MSLPDFVILGRSKERSDAAQTLGSMPGRQGKTRRHRIQRSSSPCWQQGSAPLRRSEIAAWILGSPRRRFAAAPPRMTKVEEPAN
ncbi:hypothetical protein FJV80_20600 [Mesorhizobium sp. WSM4310]|nr:hypothetical protein FJV80_20600 [Mesorhizobium sp. WSM4310]